MIVDAYPSTDMPYMESPGPRPHRPLNIFVFHDQAEDPSHVLRQLVKVSRDSPLLARLLDSCSTALRNAQAAEEWPLFDFAEHHFHFGGTDTEQVAVLSVVSCLAQLGCLALVWERDPDLFDSEKNDSSSIGLCTGSLAAAAAAYVKSTEEFLAISRELVCVAFRLGIEAKRRSRSIDDRYDVWSFIVKGVSESEAQESLDAFHTTKHLPSHRRAYISAILPHSLTVSGPPNTLDMLFQHECPLSAARRKPLHICAAFHADHLLCPDVDVILGPAKLEEFRLRPGASVSYPSVRCDEDPSLRTLLRNLIHECFQAKIRISPETNPVPPGRTPEDCTIYSIGQSGAGETLQDWLDPERKLNYIRAMADFRNGTVPHWSVPDQVAIVGYAGRFPKAETLEEFWDVIESGKDVHEFIPADRFDAKAHYNKMAKGRNATASPYGCFMKNPGHFDNEFFNMSPREAKQVDPIQRLLLMVTQEALEMSGYSSSVCRTKRVGTFFGQATDDYREANGGQDIDIFYVGGGMRAFAPGRLNYHYKWEGPSYSIDTACSSSLAALEFAFRAVQSGDCDIAVAGGGNLLSALPMFSGLSKGRFTSSTGSCKTFDAAADGYCRGEGVGVVVVKRLEDARYDGDNVKGIVSSIVTNHSAHASSITHPHSPTQEALFLRTLGAAGLDPGDIDYVEFHGTGTQAGDAAELSSVSRVFGGKRNRSTQLCVGAVKANVGHGEAAAGVTSLIKALLMIRHDTIPPHCGIKGKPNPALEKKEMISLKIPDKPMRFEPSEAPRTILINNFNATGGNTSMILRGPPKAEIRVNDSTRSHYPISVSGHSIKSLQRNLENLKRHVKTQADDKLCDLSYSTTARRLHFQYRTAITTDSSASLLEQIDQALDKVNSNKKLSQPAVAFAFAGQGTQTQGIARELYNTCTAFRLALTQYDSLCTKLGFSSFIEFLINPESKQEWTATQLQLGTVAIEMALASLWQSWGLKPGVVIGHSLGEYPALCTAGVLSITDMFSLVGERARLMEELIKPGTHAMLSVTQTASDTQRAIDEAGIKGCEISCYNAEQAVAVSGPVETLDRLNSVLAEKSVRSKKLDVQYAFHSAMIDPILEKLRSYAESIPFHKPRIPVASTLLATVVSEEGTFGPEYLSKHARQPVNFVGALKCCEESKATTKDTVWIELSPGDASCMPLIHRSGIAGDRSHLVSSFSTKTGTWDLLSKSVADCYKNGVDVDWATFHEPAENGLNFLDLPTYAFDTKSHWIPLGELPVEEQGPTVQTKISPLLHYVESISLDGKQKTAEFHSDLSDPVLYEAIIGHQVFGAALCPSSVYSSIALEAASHVSKHAGDTGDSPAFEIYRMDITRPLVVQQKSKVKLVVSVLRDENGKTTVEFSSQKDKQMTRHAKCEMKTSEQSSWRSEWSKIDFLAKSRTDMVLNSTSDSHFRLKKPVIYKLFTHVVNYGQQYHGLKRMTLDNDNKEAAGDIDFENRQDPGHKYDWNLIDTLVHLAGFVLNNGLADDEHAFISDGWDSLRIPPNLEKTGKYSCHVRLAPSKDGQVFSGDAYMFSGGEIVGSCGGVRFTKMKLKSLQAMMSKQAGGNQPSKNPTKSAEKAQSSTRSATAEKPSSSSSDTFSRIMGIIAEESGVPLHEIKESSKLADLGLDSILVTQVVDQIKDQTGVEIASSELQAIGSLSEIRGMIGDASNGSPAEAHHSHQSQQKDAHDEPQTNGDANGETPTSNGSEIDHLAVFVKVISEQAGVSAEEVKKAAKFEDLGLDSLLNLEVLSIIQDETGEEWPASFLKDHSNFGSLEKALSPGKNVDSTENASGTNGRSISPPRPDRAAPLSPDIKAKATLIQGKSSSPNTPLFLFPPGLGVPAVYTALPKHPENTPIYALTSPFVKHGLDDAFTLDTAVALYIDAVLATRPHGPYHFAGWSLGGCLAYEVARQLVLRGAPVGALVILDCPKPTFLPDSPLLTPEALTALGYDDLIVERHGGFPAHLKEHTIGAMNAFKGYDCVPMTRSPAVARCIQATLGSQELFMQLTIRSQELVNENGGNIEVAKKALRTELDASSNTDYARCARETGADGPAGWERLIPNVDARVVEADHIELLTAPEPLQKMTAFLWEALAEADRKLKQQ